MPLRLSGNPKADALLTDDPLALLIGMVLDQQVPLEWAFAAPLELKSRLGGKLKVKAIAEMDPAELSNVFSTRPALHRYPGSMAGRVQELCRLIVDNYGGDPTKIWSGAKSGSELLGRIKELPGFGEQKAKIFVALLGKQLAVEPDGWREVSSPYGEAGSLRSVADIVDADSLDRVRAWKAAAKQAAKAAKSTASAEKPKKAPTKKATTKKAVTAKKATTVKKSATAKRATAAKK